MANMTLAVPEELKHNMEGFPEINWSQVARQAFQQKVEDLEFLKQFTGKSRLTEKKALQLGAQVSKKLAKRYLRLS